MADVESKQLKSNNFSQFIEGVLVRLGDFKVFRLSWREELKTFAPWGNGGRPSDTVP